MLNRIKPSDVVIFDVDDTLAFFTQSFDIWMAQGLNIPVPDRNKFPTYNLMSPFVSVLGEKPDVMKYLKAFEASGRISSPDYMKPTSLIRLAHELQRRQVEMHALTARGWMKEPYRSTYDWLELQDLTMTVHVVEMHDSKAAWINRNINKVNSDRLPPKNHSVWIFEDNPTHIDDIARNCAFAEMPIVVDQRHNRTLLHDYERVDPLTSTWITAHDKTPA